MAFPSVSQGFMIFVCFFLGLLVIELLTGETWGVPAKRAEQPRRYWIILWVQASGAVLFVALLYFLTR
jgi:hypothetical protein